MRFLSAILDGELAAVPSVGMNSVFITQVIPDIVLRFTQTFPSWAAQGNSFSPADTALIICGSIAVTEGMVVADASLNAVKAKVCSFPPSYS